MATALPIAVAVPLNTTLADLDATVAALVRREFSRHGFDSVDVVFETPTKDWAAALSAPTVNLFLYDLRESNVHHPMEWEPHQDGDRRFETRPPLRLDASYTVTAWTREIEDEHRLLSQLLSLLYAYPELPDADLLGTLAHQPTERFPLHTRIASPRGEGAHAFWSSMGSPHKASLDYRVTISCVPGTTAERGPETRTPTVRLFDRDLPRALLDEQATVGGIVRDEVGNPVADTWVSLVDIGDLAVSGPDGRFRFPRVQPGTHRVVARAPDGRQASVSADVPGTSLDLTVTSAASSRARGRRAES